MKRGRDQRTPPGADTRPAAEEAGAERPSPDESSSEDPLQQGTKATLLLAAEELFSARGYEAVGIRDIAARADANVAAIKYHFGSKRQLYLATIRWLLEQTEIKGSWSLEELPTTRRGAARLLVDYIRGSMRETVRSGRPERCVRLMLQEALRPGEDFEFITANFSEPYENLMIELVRVISPGGSETFYVSSGRSIFAQTLHYFVWKSFLGRSPYGVLGETLSVEDASNEVARFVLRGLGCSKNLVEYAMAAANPPLPPRGRRG